LPTRRFFAFIFLAFILYFLANQTQVGWVYIMVNGLLGIVIASLIYSYGLLNFIEIKRTFDNSGDLTITNLHEDDILEITLEFRNARIKPVLLLSGHEQCPFAPVDDQKQSFFMSLLTKNNPIQLSYHVICDRRGLYTFSDVHLKSHGGFGFLTRQRTLAVPSEIMIYPRYERLKRLRVFENKMLAERESRRIGVGNQVIGTREYRHGDSLRTIHWRSTARTGKLVVKEFSRDDQLTMTVVLDLSTTANVGDGKFSTFETAIRITASLGYYARQKRVPFYITGMAKRWTPPTIALSWWSMLNYLAKVQNDGDVSLSSVLHQLHSMPFIIVLVTNPDEKLIKSLQALRQICSQILAIFITPDGDLPTIVKLKSSVGLTVLCVSPHNWENMLKLYS